MLSASCSSTALQLPLYLYLYPYCTYLFFIHLYTCEILLEYPFITTCQYIHLLHSCIHACVRLYPLKMCIGVEVKTNRHRGSTGETTSFQVLGLHGSQRWKNEVPDNFVLWLRLLVDFSGSYLRRFNSICFAQISDHVN